MSESFRLGSLDGGDRSELGVYPLLACNYACNSLILVVCYFGVGARDTDGRAGLALRDDLRHVL